MKIVLGVVVVAFGLFQIYIDILDERSKIGMDKFGRQGICEIMDQHVRSARSDWRVFCRGVAKLEIQLHLEEALSILTGAITMDKVQDGLRTQFDAKSLGVKTIDIQGNQQSGRVTRLVEAERLNEILNDQGAKSLGDALAAFGFKEYSVYAKDTDQTYFRFILSDEHFGKNPTKTISARKPN